MPHARMRKNKMARMEAGPSLQEMDRPGAFLSEAAKPLVEAGNVIRLPQQQGYDAKWNLAPRMSDEETSDVMGIIQDRYFAAKPITDDAAVKMAKWELQYQGVWQDPREEQDEHIFLAKTRQRVRIVHAFLMGLIMQMPKLLEFRPKVQTVAALKEEWQRAKLAEALVLYYMDDIWRLRVDVLPDFVKMMLKFTMGALMVSYENDPHQPDLKFNTMDRALLYFDPNTHKRRDCGWLIVKDFITRSKLDEEFQKGSYFKPRGFNIDSAGLISGSTSDETLRRLYGANYASSMPIQQDELVERWHLFQPPGKGGESRYACTLGGEGNNFLAAYGENPWPYKGIPVVWKSYDPHEWQADGTGMVEMETGLQVLLNTAVNARVDDWKRNLWAPHAIPEQFVNATTLQDWKERQSLVRFNQEAMDPLIEQGKSLQNYIVPLNMRADNSLQLFQDMQFFLSQGDEMGHTSQPFQGQATAKVMTASEVQEVLSRNQGVFRMPFMQIMRAVEEVGEISLQYFKDPTFFGPERILMTVGPTLDAVVKDWQFNDGNNRAVGITPDQMDVDVTIIATNGADALLARGYKAMVGSQLMQAVGQVEGLFPEIRDKINWKEFVLDQLRAGTSDVSMYELTPEQEAQRKAERQKEQKAAMEQQQQQMQQQMQLQAQVEQAKANAKAQGDIAVNRDKAQAEAAMEQRRLQTEMQAGMAQMAMQVKAEIQKTLTEIAAKSEADRKLLAVELGNDLKKMLVDSFLTKDQMRLEAALELKAAEQAPGSHVSVGKGGNIINQQ